MANPTELVANPLNWRIHPTHQRHALKDVLDQVGWVQDVVVNTATGNLVDGHLRVDLALQEGEAEIPVLYVELTEAEEKLVLASLDPIAGLAVADAENLSQIIQDIDGTIQGDVLRGFIEDLDAQHGDPGPDTGTQEPDPKDFWPRVSLQLPPELYSRWRDFYESLPGDADHDKVERLLNLAEDSPSHPD